MVEPDTPNHRELRCDDCGAQWWESERTGRSLCPACGKAAFHPDAPSLAQYEIDVLVAKVQTYERFLHLLHLYAEVTLDKPKLQRLIDRASAWSYAHRQGNGTLSDVERHQLVEDAFERLCDTND